MSQFSHSAGVSFSARSARFLALHEMFWGYGREIEIRGRRGEAQLNNRGVASGRMEMWNLPRTTVRFYDQSFFSLPFPRGMDIFRSPSCDNTKLDNTT